MARQGLKSRPIEARRRDPIPVQGDAVVTAPSVAEGVQVERRHSVRVRPVRRRSAAAQQRSRSSALWTTLFGAAVVLCLAYGAQEVAERQWTPKEGMGYYLGIVGGLMMLGLLLYPVRKHYRRASAWGSVASWFRAHMMLGIVGPALIIIHSGFEMNSKNGSVAMVSMLLVVASGIVGRYIYTRLHAGLYGRRTEVNDLIKEIEQTEVALSIASALPTGSIKELKVLADTALASTRTLRGCVAFRAGRSARRNLKRATHTDIETSVAAAALNSLAAPAAFRHELDKAHAALDSYFLMVEQIGSVRFYERAFHAWHVLHLPLFFLLVAAAILHVVAVHLY